jgi:hypothetical protein
MSDERPPLQDRKLLYIAPVIIAALVLLILVVALSHQPQAPTVPVPRAASPQAPPAPPPAPSLATAAPPPVLTRQDLIEKAAETASVFASQGRLPPDADSYAGRRFSVRIAFGCGGVLAGNGTGQATSSFDAAKQTVTLTARPGDWTSLPVVQTPGDATGIEAVEGFWLPRPWSLAEGCPPDIAYPVPATPTAPTAQTLGLAEFFADDTSRAGRHADHPYEFTRKIAADDTAVLGHGYWLVLEGRITGDAHGGALHCWMESPSHQPLCIYSVEFDHVAFVDGVSGDVLANWND